MKVSNEITIYEIDGEETLVMERPSVTISSHWNRNEMVVLVIDEGRAYTVSATSLEMAIKNATNWK